MGGGGEGGGGEGGGGEGEGGGGEGGGGEGGGGEGDGSEPSTTRTAIANATAGTSHRTAAERVRTALVRPRPRTRGRPCWAIAASHHLLVPIHTIASIKQLKEACAPLGANSGEETYRSTPSMPWSGTTAVFQPGGHIEGAACSSRSPRIGCGGLSRSPGRGLSTSFICVSSHCGGPHPLGTSDIT